MSCVPGHIGWFYCQNVYSTTGWVTLRSPCSYYQYDLLISASSTFQAQWLLCIPLIPTTRVYPDRITTTLHNTSRWIFIIDSVICEVGTIVQDRLYSFQPPKGSRICRNECNVVKTKQKCYF